MKFSRNQKHDKSLKQRLRERALKGVAARAARRLARVADAPAEMQRIPAGEHLGVLAWHGANNIAVIAMSKQVHCGWDHLLRSLRKNLARPKRRFVDIYPSHTKESLPPQ